MRVRKVLVPRSIVFRHGLHPEPYGESIAIFENGMFTDVYTDEKGRLFTMTNNEKLTKYLMGFPKKEIILEINDGDIKFQSIRNKDCRLLNKWLSESPFYRYDKVIESEEIVRCFISHSWTMNSHIFIVSKTRKFGIIGFSLIDDVVIVNFEIYEYNYILAADINKSIALMIDYLKHNYQFNKILFYTFEYDNNLIEAYERFNLEKESVPILKLTLDGIQKEFIYKLDL